VDAHLLDRAGRLARTAMDALRSRLLRWTRPATASSLILGAAADPVRSRSELVAENALVRQQLIVLARTVKHPQIARSDRPLLVVLASRVRRGARRLLIVQPETLLRWHREGFRLVWRWRSASLRRPPCVAPETIALVRRMAREHRLRGAERIQGELAQEAVDRGGRAGRHPGGPVEQRERGPQVVDDRRATDRPPPVGVEGYSPPRRGAPRPGSSPRRPHGRLGGRAPRPRPASRTSAVLTGRVAARTGAASTGSSNARMRRARYTRSFLTF
jgi:hypothetical protein